MKHDWMLYVALMLLFISLFLNGLADFGREKKIASLSERIAALEAPPDTIVFRTKWFPGADTTRYMRFIPMEPK